MDWRQRGRDRRSSPRFEVVGLLHGSAVCAQYVTVHNVGSGGALVESQWPVPMDVPLTLKLTGAEPSAPVAIRIRHVRRQLPAGYLIGLEFPSPRFDS